MKLSDEIKTLIRGANFAHFATLMTDGSPQVAPVWVDLEGDSILVCTGEGSLKAKNTRRDPRVGLSIIAMDNPYQEAQLRGRIVERRPDPEFKTMDRSARKYTGRPFLAAPPSRRDGARARTPTTEPADGARRPRADIGYHADVRKGLHPSFGQTSPTIGLPAGRSVAVELDRVTVRVFDIDRGVTAAAVDPDARVLDARANLLPLGAREMQAEVVEPSRVRIQSGSRPDEVQEILPTGRLEEDHPVVGKCALETEDVDVEALGGRKITRLEGQMTEPTTIHHGSTGPTPLNTNRCARLPLSTSAV